MNKKRNKINKVMLISIIIIILISVNTIAIKDLMELQGTAKEVNGKEINGNITVKIYEEELGGIPIYDSENDFNQEVKNGIYDIMLGSGTKELNLDFGKYYYLDININNEDIDFGDYERFKFQSTIGTMKNISLNGDNLIITGGNVGIGTTSPSYKLDVVGTISTNNLECTNCISLSEVDSSQVQKRVTGTCSSGYGIRTIDSNGAVSCEYDSSGSCSCSCSGYFLSEDYSDTWNEYGYAYDFRFEGDNEQNLLFLDGSKDYIGIGKSNPESRLDVDGTIRVTGQNTPSSGAGIEMFYDGSKSHINSISRPSTRRNLEIVGNQITILTGTNTGNHAQRLFIDNNGDVGIGTTSPSYKLDVNGAIRASDEIISSHPDSFRMAFDSYGVIHRNDGVGYYILLTNSGDPYGSYTSKRPLTITFPGNQIQLDGGAIRAINGGNVASGKSPGAHSFEVQGDAGKTTGTSWISLSDKRLKNITKNIDNGLEIISKLKPIKYKWNELYKEKYGNNNDTMYGFTAQNVREVLPEMVKEDKEGYLWYNPNGYEAVLTKALQELKTRNKEIKKEICKKNPSYSYCD